MPSYMLGEYLDTVVSVHFPGGRLGFAKSGCSMLVAQVPGDKDIVYVLVPRRVDDDLDLSTFRQKFEEACEAKRVRVRWASVPNFEDAKFGEFKDTVLSMMRGIAGIDPLAIVAFHKEAVAAVIKGRDRKQADRVLDLIGESGLVRRAVVVMDVGCVEREWEVVPKEPAKPEVTATKAEPERGGRVITKDDVTDLTIDIERCDTVEDFLNKF